MRTGLGEYLKDIASSSVEKTRPQADHDFPRHWFMQVSQSCSSRVNSRSIRTHSKLHLVQVGSGIFFRGSQKKRGKIVKKRIRMKIFMIIFV